MPGPGDLFQPHLIPGIALNLIFLDPLDKHKGKMGPEPGRQVKTVFRGNFILAGKIEFFEMVGDFFKIGNGGRFSFLKGLDQDHIFNGCPQGMSGKSLGIGNADAAQVPGKGRFKGCHLCIGAAAPGRGIGLVGHEQKLICIVFFPQTRPGLHL